MIEYTKENPLRVFEAFAGYGSQAMALERLHEMYPEFHHVIVGISEIDKYAIKAYMAVHGETTNYGDISQIDANNLPDFDLFTYSFPCQDISLAGLQRGLTEGSGTRSSLLWECRKIIQAKRPRFLLMENVKALVSKKLIGEYHKWEQWLESQGYATFTQVLNATDYQTPQNRERVFAVSILDKNARYSFPRKLPLEKCIEDIEEEDVSEAYFLTDERAAKLRLFVPEDELYED